MGIGSKNNFFYQMPPGPQAEHSALSERKPPPHTAAAAAQDSAGPASRAARPAPAAVPPAPNSGRVPAARGPSLCLQSRSTALGSSSPCAVPCSLLSAERGSRQAAAPHSAQTPAGRSPASVRTAAERARSERASDRRSAEHGRIRGGWVRAEGAALAESGGEAPGWAEPQGSEDAKTVLPRSDAGSPGSQSRTGTTAPEGERHATGGRGASAAPPCRAARRVRSPLPVPCEEPRGAQCAGAAAGEGARPPVGGAVRGDVTTRRGRPRRHFELAAGRRGWLPSAAPRPPRKPGRRERGPNMAANRNLKQVRIENSSPAAPLGMVGGGGGLKGLRGLETENEAAAMALVPGKEGGDEEQEGGFTIDIKSFLKPGEKSYTQRCRLFVGNLPTDITEEDFKRLFERYGEPSEVFINRDRGFGFIRLVSFARGSAAARRCSAPLSPRGGREAQPLPRVLFLSFAARAAPRASPSTPPPPPAPPCPALPSRSRAVCPWFSPLAALRVSGSSRGPSACCSGCARSWANGRSCAMCSAR